MKRSSGLFWGVLIILIGGLFLLRNLGYITVSVWGMIWPLMLILAGIWVLFGLRGMWGGAAEAQMINVPLEGAESAHLDIEHGLGSAVMTGAVEGSDLIAGTFGGGLRYSSRVEGGIQRLRMRMADLEVGSWYHGLNWDFQVNGRIPLTIKLQGGAGILNFDMHDLQVKELKYEAGVGSARVTFPASAGLTTATIKAGVGSMTLDIPQGVAAQIKVDSGLGTITVPRERFPQNGNVYRSPDYDTAENRIDLKIEGGLGTIRIR